MSAFSCMYLIPKTLYNYLISKADNRQKDRVLQLNIEQLNNIENVNESVLGKSSGFHSKSPTSSPTRNNSLTKVCERTILRDKLHTPISTNDNSDSFTKTGNTVHSLKESSVESDESLHGSRGYEHKKNQVEKFIQTDPYPQCSEVSTCNTSSPNNESPENLSVQETMEVSEENHDRGNLNQKNIRTSENAYVNNMENAHQSMLAVGEPEHQEETIRIREFASEGLSGNILPHMILTDQRNNESNKKQHLNPKKFSSVNNDGNNLPHMILRDQQMPDVSPMNSKSFPSTQRVTQNKNIRKIDRKPEYVKKPYPSSIRKFFEDSDQSKILRNEYENKNLKNIKLKNFSKTGANPNVLPHMILNDRKNMLSASSRKNSYKLSNVNKYNEIIENTLEKDVPTKKHSHHSIIPQKNKKAQGSNVLEDSNKPFDGKPGKRKSKKRDYPDKVTVTISRLKSPPEKKMKYTNW